MLLTDKQRFEILQSFRVGLSLAEVMEMYTKTFKTPVEEEEPKTQEKEKRMHVDAPLSLGLEAKMDNEIVNINHIYTRRQWNFGVGIANLPQIPQNMCMSDIVREKDPRVINAIDTGLLLVSAYNSFAEHFGSRAFAAANGGFIDQALQLLRELGGWNGDDDQQFSQRARNILLQFKLEEEV